MKKNHRDCTGNVLSAHEYLSGYEQGKQSRFGQRACPNGWGYWNQNTYNLKDYVPGKKPLVDAICRNVFVR